MFKETQKRWNPTPNWLDAVQHPPPTGWYRARLSSDTAQEFEAFSCSSRVWYRADYSIAGHRTQGARLNECSLSYISDGR